MTVCISVFVTTPIGLTRVELLIKPGVVTAPKERLTRLGTYRWISGIGLTEARYNWAGGEPFAFVPVFRARICLTAVTCTGY